MSQCRAPDCPSKNYTECKTRENAGTCSVRGTVPPNSATYSGCNSKSAGETSWSRTPSECPSGITDQNTCEKVQGCEWTYESPGATTLNHIRKVCKPEKTPPTCTAIDSGSTSDISTCGSVTGEDLVNENACEGKADAGSAVSICTYTPSGIKDFTCDEKFTPNKGRYNLIEPDTFGCDRTKCDYLSQKKALIPGVCRGVNCNGKTIQECVDDAVCTWEPNDGGYCGYNRNIEYALENENKNDPTYVGGVGEITDILLNNNDDPCLRIQNPGREECELEGCIWDIYGNRTTPQNIYNSINGTLIDNYYDISSTGLCKMPKTENCMNYFCSRQSGDSIANINFNLPDGRCENDSGSSCISRDREIVARKTPGLITYLPDDFPTQPDSSTIPRSWYGSNNDNNDNYEIRDVNLLLGLKYNKNLATVGDKENIPNMFQEIYKDNCEYNMEFPMTTDDDEIQYKYEKRKSIYDYDSDSCINEKGVALLTDPLSGNPTTPSFYGNCRNQTFYHKDSGPAAEYVNAGDISDKNRCSIKIKQPIVDLFVDSSGSTVLDTTQRFRKSAYNALRSPGTCSLPSYATIGDCSTGPSLWRSGLKHNIYNTHHSTNYTEEVQSTGASLTTSIGPTNNVTIDILEQTQRNVECRTKFYEIVEILKGLVGSGTDGLKQIKGTIGTGTLSISPNDNYHGFSIDGTGYYPKTTEGVGELYNHIRVKINEASYGAPMKAALQGLFGDTLNIGDTAISFSNISETPVDINNSVLYGLGICSDGGTPTNDRRATCLAGASITWTPDTSNIILSISKKLQLEYISEEEYSSEVARYLASLVVYEETCELKSGQIEPTAADCNTLDAAACAQAAACQLREWNDSNTNPLSCMYDPYGQEYIYYEDGRATAFCTVQQNVIDACTTIGGSDDTSPGTVGADCNADQNCTYDAGTSICGLDPSAVGICSARTGNMLPAQVITAATGGVMTTVNSGAGSPNGFSIGDSVVVSSVSGAGSCGIEGTYTLSAATGSTITVSGGFNAALGTVGDCQVERLVSGSCSGIPECEYRAVIPTHNKDLYMYQKLAEVLPVSLDQGSSVNDLIGTGSGANLIENISTNHRIKDIIYKPGKAIVTLQYQTPSGGVVEPVLLTDLTVSGNIAKIILGSISASAATGATDTLIFNNSTQSPGRTRFNKLFDGTKEYTYDNKSFKKYIGGIVEIEIDGVDPGCFGADGVDPEGFCSRSGEIFTLPDAVKFVVSDGGGANEWMIKEVRLKDVPVDIYFEGDIDGLYKVNDIISIDGGNGFISDIFNPNLKLPDGGKYQQIRDIDIENNKITVGNTRRRGKYFVNRGRLEEYHYVDPPQNCVKSSGSGAPAAGVAGVAPGLTNEAPSTTGTICDLKHDLYDKCIRKSKNEGAPGTDSRCLNDPHCALVGPRICQPIGIDGMLTTTGSGIAASVEYLKCNESLGNKDYLMEKTVCPTEVVTTGPTGVFNHQYEDMIRTTATSTTGQGSGFSLIAPGQNDNKYIITDVIEAVVVNIPRLSLSESGLLDDWRIRYLYWDATNTLIDIGEGRIINHEYVASSTTHKIKIQRNKDVLESEDIYPLSIKPPNINQLKLGDHTDLPVVMLGDAGNSFDITIKNYVRKKVSNLQPSTQSCTGIATNPAATEDCGAAFAAEPPATAAANCASWGCTYNTSLSPLTSDIKIEYADSKEECDFYNGIWDYASCNRDDEKKIRASDLCEKTGFIFNEEINLCYKEKNSSVDDAYCRNKTNISNEQVNWDNHNSGSDEGKYPCSVCKWNNAGKKCEELPRSDCTSLDINNCGINSANHNRPGTSSVPSSCEYYRHNMDSITIEIDGTDIEMRQSEFMCSESDDVSATSATCSAHQTLGTCEPSQNPTGCEWQCPLAQGEEHPGYKITLASDRTPPPTTQLGGVASIHYFSPGGIHVECDDAAGYEVIPGDPTLPKAQCIRNSDDSTVGNHSEILGFVGCVKRLNCKNTEFTLEKIQTMFSNDASSVPSNFIKDGELDQNKFPDINGNFKCPSPSIIIDNPDTVTGWDEDTCCINVGLCTGNDIGPNIICPDGQEIIMKYYEGNPTLSSHVGTTQEECCEAPPVPTITIPLDADYKELVDYDDGITFKKAFTTDIVGILNDTKNENNDLSFTITEDMIEIVYIEEGSIIVTFKINKGIDGKVVLKNQLQRILKTGTFFKEVGHATKGAPDFKEYDPADKYLIYRDGQGLTLDQVIISIIITISLCFFCLVTIGMLMK